MRIRGIRPGDLVMVDKRGRRFYARVLEAGATEGLSLEPLDRCISWRRATAREIIGHWTGAAPEAQLRLDGDATT